MGYSNHTESTESKTSLRVEQPPSELRSALCDVNETPLSCRSEQYGLTYRLEMDAAAGFALRNIAIFTLFFDIFDQV